MSQAIYRACTDYVHRIGRTARAGKRGSSWTLFTPDDAKMARDLIRILSEAHQAIPPELQRYAEMRGGGGGGRRGLLHSFVLMVQIVFCSVSAGGPRDRWGRDGSGPSRFGMTGANAIPTAPMPGGMMGAGGYGAPVGASAIPSAGGVMGGYGGAVPNPMPSFPGAPAPMGGYTGYGF